MKKLCPDEFVELLPDAQRRVGAFVRAIMPRNSDVDEIVQSTLVIAWKKLAEFGYRCESPDGEFVRWLCTIARFEALALARRLGDERLVFDDRIVDQIVELQTGNLSNWDDRRAALRHCVGKLVQSDRTLVEQIYGGTPVSSVAESVGKSRQAVYKSLRRIRRSLLACIKAQLRAWEA